MNNRYLVVSWYLSHTVCRLYKMQYRPALVIRNYSQYFTVYWPGPHMFIRVIILISRSMMEC